MTDAPHAAETRQTTLITGGSRGIGAAIAERLAAAGHDLVLTFRNRRGEAEAVAEECRALGARVELLQVDLADLEQTARVVPDAIGLLGGLTGLVNNAGITGRISGFLEIPIEESELVFRVNVLAPIVLTRAAIEHMSTDRGGIGGSIVNISSSAASTGAPDTYVPYAMSKGAINVLTLGTAREFASAGVRVNTVTPGTTFTEIHAAAGRPNAPEERASRIPMQRAGYPHEIAGAVAYLFSAEASYTTGADIRVAGGH
ncbi:SDR family NAD(P)-dependent oxidoreductase [Agromyces aerolatus]|uniref:SDR family NAD(P)-dependent oxidoreductase n=1 Tax=Agromyces sp. LY-1074 TaxID=3074080 RepID=UPI00285BB481|nr:MULTISPECIES: SDR family oxidoreductase [unclassified Agromyces]MDR5700114.1 SDR family oxidoreductase [Agromyces sp. LY-1074]MDR5706518.1 SDR family oxidoreductase [Agromyces sp. LY-1358]